MVSPKWLRPLLQLLERANGILTSTNDIGEDEVDRIAKELLEVRTLLWCGVTDIQPRRQGYGHGTRHAKLRRCVAWSLYVRLDMPEIFLIPPLDKFSEEDSVFCGKGSFSSVYQTKYQGKDVAVKVLSQETLDEVYALFPSPFPLSNYRFRREHRQSCSEFGFPKPWVLLMSVSETSGWGDALE